MRHWFLASNHDSGGDADSDVLDFFVKNPRVRPYSAAGWRQTNAPKTMQIGDHSRLSQLVDQVTGEPGSAVAIESVVFKKAQAEAKVALWSDNAGLAHGPIYTLVRTKRGWVVDSLRTGYWGAVN